MHPRWSSSFSLSETTFEPEPGPHGRFIVAGLLMAILFSSGCISKSKAREQARLAYLAGQSHAIEQMRAQGSGAERIHPVGNVTFIGPVDDPIQEWTPDLSLAQAILNAGYHSNIDPAVIIIQRSTEVIEITPARLLGGDHFPLRPGDVIQFQMPPQ
jgi:hypothetical protein